MARALKARGVKAWHYHAGMTPHERKVVQFCWSQGTLHVVCATIAYGMGIDKARVGWVDEEWTFVFSTGWALTWFMWAWGEGWISILLMGWALTRLMWAWGEGWIPILLMGWTLTRRV